ncbi:MAG: sigma-54 dependent transcriptional regulator [Gammaproteobacteria bacterium]
MTNPRTPPLVLIVDDEPDIRELLALTLSRMQLECLDAENLQQARQLLQRQRFDLCLTDMRLPDGSGIEFIREMQQTWPETPVAMITAHGNMNSAIEALKAGAFDFLNKPVELQTLRELVSSALRLTAPLPDKADSAPGPQLLGHSAAIDRIRTTARKLARSQAPVYISGESGTGKELVARLIHAQGPRGEAPFIAVNCGAIPADLMESELFGHKKGSFTGASSDKAGLFQAAHGGTLFLDEVADLPLEMQVKLLRAIQEKAVRPIGAQKEDHIDVRILSATHKNLAEQVQHGHFREDLFYRINVIELHIPPLRERPEDIPPLVEMILASQAQTIGISRPRLSDAALATLSAYPFPGNVRELENILERAITLSEEEVIYAEDLHLATTARHQDEEVNAEEGVLQVGLEAYLEGLERKLIQQALQKTRHNKTAAAKRLGISFRALRYRLKKLGLE